MTRDLVRLWLRPTLLVLGCAVISSASWAASLAEISTPAAVTREFNKTSRLRLLNVWATWCRPCIEEMPDLQAIDAGFAADELEVIGLSLDDAIPGERAEIKKKVERFLASRSITFENFYFTGRVPELQDHFAFEGEIPITILYDASGRELWRFQGAIDREELTATIRKNLKTSSK